MASPCVRVGLATCPPAPLCPLTPVRWLTLTLRGPPRISTARTRTGRPCQRERGQPRSSVRPPSPPQTFAESLERRPHADIPGELVLPTPARGTDRMPSPARSRLREQGAGPCRASQLRPLGAAPGGSRPAGALLHPQDQVAADDFGRRRHRVRTRAARCQGPPVAPADPHR